MKYIICKTNDPEYNLAFEEYCFKNLPVDKDEFFYFWINEPSIIVGKNQNVHAEVNLDYIKENQIKVVRRITGGGAVYHDLNNINYSHISKSKGAKKLDFKNYYQLIVDALNNMGINAELSGRNDITVDGLKIAGSSQSIWKDRVLSNCCILYNVDLEELSKALNVRPEKLTSKGVKSVRARVTNIKPLINIDLSTVEFLNKLQKEIFNNLNIKGEEYILSPEELKGVDEIYKNRFSSRQWNYGKVHNTKYYKYKRFPIGFVELFFDLEDEKVKNLKIMGDFFGTKDVSELENLLEDSNYDNEEFLKRLKNVNLADYFGEISEEEFSELFFQ
ncbi:MAG: lipoate--protein ligase [Tissierellia bacterium]|jgi:lipoate-protein ligase A|nr:lipoate--protein ligase [Tissierellia bacterium]